MAIYFSPSKLSFFDGALEANYKAAGNWPSDAATITDTAWQTYTAQPPAGKVLGAVNGEPTWVDAPAPPTPTLAQQAQILIASGLTITSTGTPALNGTYTVASGVPFGREDIQTEAQFVSTFSEFTNGTTTLDWPLIDGKTMVTFPTTAAFLNFAKAAGQFYAAAMSVGRAGTGTLPSATATIP